MTSFIRAIPLTAPFGQALPLVALIGAAILATPMPVAYADNVKAGPALMAQAVTPKPPTGAPMASDKPETVEARITDLHAKLQITAAEEPKWTDVAKAMRDNATAMDKLVADKKAQAAKGMTAVEDLLTYQTFAQAHVDGLKRLTSAFKALYATMPAAQKLVADQVFMQFGRTAQPTHG